MATGPSPPPGTNVTDFFRTSHRTVARRNHRRKRKNLGIAPAPIGTSAVDHFDNERTRFKGDNLVDQNKVSNFNAMIAMSTTASRKYNDGSRLIFASRRVPKQELDANNTRSFALQRDCVGAALEADAVAICTVIWTSKPRAAMR